MKLKSTDFHANEIFYSKFYCAFTDFSFPLSFGSPQTLGRYLNICSCFFPPSLRGRYNVHFRANRRVYYYYYYYCLFFCRQRSIDASENIGNIPNTSKISLFLCNWNASPFETTTYYIEGLTNPHPSPLHISDFKDSLNIIFKARFLITTNITIFELCLLTRSGDIFNYETG